MRSVIRNYLFRDFVPVRSDCPVCAVIGTGLHVEYEAAGATGYGFPPEVLRLTPPNRELERQYADEQLRQCPECGEYLSYKEWQPGGSDDAMRTYTHEMVSPIGFLETHLLLIESETTIERWFHESPGTYNERYDLHREGMSKVLDALRRNRRRIVTEAVRFLQSHAADRITVYRDECIAGEAEVSQVLSGYLVAPKALPLKILLMATDLLADTRDGVREGLGGFIAGVFALAEHPSFLRKMQARLSALPPTAQTADMQRAIERILGNSVSSSSFDRS